MSQPHRLLVVANESLGGDALIDELGERAGDDLRVHVLVPAEGAGAGGAFVGGPTSSIGAGEVSADRASASEEPERRRARDRLVNALQRVRDLGVEEVDGEIGEEDPVEAVERVLGVHDFDEILVITTPSGVSGLLKIDLASRLERRVDLPVRHIEGPPGAPAD